MTLTIRNDRPMPQKKWGIMGELPTLRNTISNMKTGESFNYPGKRLVSLYVAAKDVSAKITIRKQNGTGYIVWRVK